MNNTQSLMTDLSRLAVDLWKESQHEHIDITLYTCPHCWKKIMAVDLLNYVDRQITARNC